MFSPDQIRLVMLPPIGADARLFDRMRGTFPHLEVPRYISPRRREPLAEYAARLALTIPAHAADDPRPFYLGGSSFGAIMARVPSVAMVVLPFKPLWMSARGGTLQPGDLAPAFTLPILHGDRSVTLSAEYRQKPVVLVFGSYT